MLRYETIERLQQSLFYSRKNHKSYSIKARQLKNNDTLNIDTIDYIGSIDKNLMFKAYKKLIDTVFLNNSIKDGAIIDSYSTKLSGAFNPDMNIDNNILSYVSGRDKSILFTNSNILVRNPEYMVEKDSDISADDNKLFFSMKQDESNRSTVLNKNNSLPISKTKKSIIIIHTVDMGDGAYLSPNMGTVLDKTEYSSYDAITYVMGAENIMNSLQDIKRDIKKISSIIKIPLTQNIEIKHSQKQIRVFVKDYGLGGGTAGVGDLEITLEVYKLTEMRFKLPKGYLDGLTPNGVAHANGDVLVVFTRELGEVTLYTDKGSVKIRTLPGMKINKRRIIGEEADMFGQS